MNDNIMKAQIFHEILFDLKAHRKSQKKIYV